MAGQETVEDHGRHNVLVRAIVRDDLEQSRLAEKVLSDADSVVVPLPVLCELAWVLRTRYPA